MSNHIRKTYRSIPQHIGELAFDYFVKEDSILEKLEVCKLFQLHGKKSAGQIFLINPWISDNLTQHKKLRILKSYFQGIMNSITSITIGGKDFTTNSMEFCSKLFSSFKNLQTEHLLEISLILRLQIEELTE